MRRGVAANPVKAVIPLFCDVSLLASILEVAQTQIDVNAPASRKSSIFCGGSTDKLFVGIGVVNEQRTNRRKEL
jgi:hypothetical protein